MGVKMKLTKELQYVAAVEAKKLPDFKDSFITSSVLSEKNITLPDIVWVKRGPAEHDDTYRQILPYCLVVDKDLNILTYQRGKGGGEDRLHNLYSIGIGGHVDLYDEYGHPLQSYYGNHINDSLERELQEEIYIDRHHEVTYGQLSLINYYEDNSANKDTLVYGWIISNNNDVGKKHLGLVYIYIVDNDEAKELILKEGEEDIANRSFKTIDEIMSMYDSLEDWSQILIKNLFNNIPYLRDMINKYKKYCSC